MRSRHLKLPTLQYRRILGDMVELFKNITRKYDSNCGVRVYLRYDTVHASYLFIYL